MDEERFNRIAQEGKQKLTAVLSPFVGVKGGQAIAYNAYFKGTEVVVMGYQYEEGGHSYTKPLAILVDEEVFGLLEVDHETGRGKAPAGS
jgi:hypothetical protein